MEMLSAYDIIGLSETFLQYDFDFTGILDNYICIQKHAVKLNLHGRPSGGMMLLYEKKLSQFVTQIQIDLENVIVIDIDKKWLGTANNILFVSIYIHPIGSPFYMNKDYTNTLDPLEEFLLDFTESHGERSLLIGGDANSRIGLWTNNDLNDDEEQDEDESPDYWRLSEDKQVNSHGRRMIEMATCLRLLPVHGMIKKGFAGDFTYHAPSGDSVIDHFFCSVDILDLVTDFRILNRIEARHLPITLQIGKTPGGQAMPAPMVKCRKIAWDQDKANLYIEALNSESIQNKLEALHDTTEVNEQCTLFKDALLLAGHCMEKTFRVGGTLRTRREWFDEDCREKKKLAKRLLNRFKKAKSLEKRQELKREYHEARTTYNNLIDSKKKEHKRKLYEQLEQNKQNSSTFWSIVKKLRKTKRPMADIDIETWKNHFEEVFKTGHDTQTYTDNTDQEVVTDNDLDRDIDDDDIILAIKSLKRGKSAGADSLPPEFLKETGEILVPYLKSLFNNIFRQGNFPEEWAKAIIVPIHKKGAMNDVSNYRGISLLSIVSKVFMTILTQRLTLYVEDKELLNLEQAGFRRGFSTIDHIYTLYQIISNGLFGNSRSKTYVAFIDYRKAFDSVRRDVLWKVLREKGISDKMINMIRGIYKKVEGSVRYGTKTSEAFECPIGLRQGCVMSPLLFSLLISKVSDEINRKGKHGYQFLPGTPEIKNLMFADDISAISMTPTGLQHTLTVLEETSRELGLQINLDKTKVIVFRAGGYLSSREVWTINNSKLEVVNAYRYLGYTLTTKLSREVAMAEAVGKAKQKVIALKKLTQTLGYHSYSVYFRVFDAVVASGLQYSSEVWGARPQECLERPHTMACKKYLGVKAKTPNCLVYGELARFPLAINSKLRAVSYWLRLLDMDDTRLPKLAYLRELKENRKTKSWCNDIKDILDHTGFSNVWTQKNPNIIPNFFKTLKRRLLDIFIQDWQATINSSNRCYYYRQIKEDFCIENYIENITITKFKFAFARIRLGANALKINNLFIQQIPDTKCPFCDKEESTLHFLTCCDTYKEIREKYLQKYITDTNQNNTNRLSYWLCTQDTDMIRNVAMFVHYGLIRRQQHQIDLNRLPRETTG